MQRETKDDMHLSLVDFETQEKQGTVLLKLASQDYREVTSRAAENMSWDEVEGIIYTKLRARFLMSYQGETAVSAILEFEN